jgi:DNA-binding Lrp family transcriptional regulator
MDLDLLDRKIVYLLSINGRFSETSIARALKTSKEVVHYRIKKLQQEGFLHGFLTLMNAQKLGLVVHDIQLSLHPFHDYKGFINQLAEDEHITHIKHCSSPGDIQFRVATSDVKGFVKYLDEFLNKNHNYIHDYSISTILDEEFLGLGFLIEDPNERPHITEKKGSSFQKEFVNSSLCKSLDRTADKAVDLDDKDREILQHIKFNARSPILKVSQAVQLATTSVQKRMSTLVEQGVISHFIPYASFSYLGYQWYMLHLRTKNLNQNRFRHYLKEHPNIVWVSKRLGKWNYHLSVFVKNTTELNKVVQDLRHQFLDSIIAYGSCIVFKQHKFSQ